MFFLSSKTLKWLIGSGFLIFVLWLGLVTFSTSQLPPLWTKAFTHNAEMDKESIQSSAARDDSNEFWSHVDLKKLPLPEGLVFEAKNISLEEISLSFPKGTVHVLKTSPKKNPSHLTLLLLHGAAFDAGVWRDLGTLQLFAALGYQTYALDLPGYGKTKGTFPESPVEFMSELFAKLGLKKDVVFVSPSMSGSFSLAFLVSQPEFFAGFFPVAPVQTELIPASRYANLSVPTVIFYGVRDERLGLKSLENLRLIPRHHVVAVPDAGHAVYLDQPAVFHQVLFNFLQILG